MSTIDIIATFGLCTAPMMAERLIVDSTRGTAEYAVGEISDDEGVLAFVRNDQEPHETWSMPLTECREITTRVLAAIAAPEVLVGGYQTVLPRVIVRWQSIDIPGVSATGLFDAASAEPGPSILRKMADSDEGLPAIRQWAREALAKSPHSRPTAVRELINEFVRAKRHGAA